MRQSRITPEQRAKQLLSSAEQFSGDLFRLTSNAAEAATPLVLLPGIEGRKHFEALINYVHDGVDRVSVVDQVASTYLSMEINSEYTGAHREAALNGVVYALSRFPKEFQIVKQRLQFESNSTLHDELPEKKRSQLALSLLAIVEGADYIHHANVGAVGIYCDMLSGESASTLESVRGFRPLEERLKEVREFFSAKSHDKSLNLYDVVVDLFPYLKEQLPTGYRENSYLLHKLVKRFKRNFKPDTKVLELPLIDVLSDLVDKGRAERNELLKVIGDKLTDDHESVSSIKLDDAFSIGLLLRATVHASKSASFRNECEEFFSTKSLIDIPEDSSQYKASTVKVAAIIGYWQSDRRMMPLIFEKLEMLSQLAEKNPSAALYVNLLASPVFRVMAQTATGFTRFAHSKIFRRLVETVVRSDHNRETKASLTRNAKRFDSSKISEKSRNQFIESLINAPDSMQDFNGIDLVAKTLDKFLKKEREVFEHAILCAVEKSLKSKKMQTLLSLDDDKADKIQQYVPLWVAYVVFNKAGISHLNLNRFLTLVTSIKLFSEEQSPFLADLELRIRKLKTA
jgi:hypothetical protein